MSEKPMPDAPYTVEACKGAMRATETLIVGSNTVRQKRFWERILRAWEKRLAEAKEREHADV